MITGERREVKGHLFEVVWICYNKSRFWFVVCWGELLISKSEKEYVDTVFLCYKLDNHLSVLGID